MDEEIKVERSSAVVVCRCEHLTWDAIEEAMAMFQPTSLRQLKLVTRWGMGICQGRMCRPIMAAFEQREENASLGALAVRPPFKPVSLGTLGRMGEDA